MMRKLIDQIKQVIISPWQAVLFLVMPLLLTLFFGLDFGQGIIEHTRTVLVDQDRTALSRSVTAAFRSNRGFDVVAELDDLEAAQGMIGREEADLVLAVPADFSRDLKNGRGPAVLLIANAANMAISSNALKRASEIIITFNIGAGIQRLQGKGFLPAQAANIARPLRLQVPSAEQSFRQFL